MLVVGAGPTVDPFHVMELDEPKVDGALLESIAVTPSFATAVVCTGIVIAVLDAVEAAAGGLDVKVATILVVKVMDELIVEVVFE